MSLEEVLLQQKGRDLLERFLEKRNQLHILRCYLDIYNFAESEMTQDERLATAREIFNCYVEQGAPNIVDISDELSKRLAASIRPETIAPDTFDQVAQHVHHKLDLELADLYKTLSFGDVDDAHSYLLEDRQDFNCRHRCDYVCPLS
jgi:midasin (ATPase involved in ribosome maturation)